MLRVTAVLSFRSVAGYTGLTGSENQPNTIIRPICVHLCSSADNMFTVSVSSSFASCLGGKSPSRNLIGAIATLCAVWRGRFLAGEVAGLGLFASVLVTVAWTH